jgi:hypothetical protein
MEKTSMTGRGSEVAEEVPNVFCVENLTEGRKKWENPTVIVTLDSKRRLTVPAGVMPAKPGDHFLVDFDAEEDALVYRRIASETDWLQVLKECPVPMQDLPQRRREYFRSKL